MNGLVLSTLGTGSTVGGCIRFGFNGATKENDLLSLNLRASIILPVVGICGFATPKKLA